MWQFRLQQFQNRDRTKSLCVCTQQPRIRLIVRTPSVECVAHCQKDNELFTGKCVHFLSRPGTAVGCDFVGVVAKLGPGVLASTRHVGERVAGFINGSGERENHRIGMNSLA